MWGSAERGFGPHIATSEDELVGLTPRQLLRPPPERDWMVEGCFLRGTVGLIAGDGGIGKSLCAQQLCTSATLARPWLGLHVKKGRALHLACEDDGDEMHRRQIDINRSLGADMEDVLEGGIELHGRVGRDNALVAFDRPSWRMKRTGLMDRLIKLCRMLGVQYVIVDTATATFRGNQNDEIQVNDYVTELRRLAVAIQGVVVITKHPSVTGRASGTGESGSVAWENSVRARLYLHNSKERGLVLAGMKANYGRKLDPIPLRWSRGVFERIDAPAPRDYSEAGGYSDR